jgi:hypothetical protein
VTKSKALNLIFILLWPLVALGLSLSFPVNAFLSTVLFYGIPSLVLSLERPDRVKKSLLLAAMVVPFMLVVDYIAVVSGSWASDFTIFSFKILGILTVDELIWVFLEIYFILIFYSVFFEKKQKPMPWKTYERFLSSLAVALAVFVLALGFIPGLFAIPYWYLVFGIVFILPPIVVEMCQFPGLSPRFIKTTFYFLYLNFIYELMALKFGWWYFPGHQFIGRVTFFGLSFPFEEMLFWVILLPWAILSCYEYFFDDKK